MKPNVTVRAGLKWEYFSPVKEDDNLAFVPIANNRPMAEVMLDPAATVSFADGYLWKRDLNNFGPALGISWDPFKDGRTAIRAGYSLTFVNEESVTIGIGVVGGNAGLSTAVTVPNLSFRLAQGVPAIVSPDFKPVRTLGDQTGVSATSVVRGMDAIRQAAARASGQRRRQPRDPGGTWRSRRATSAPSAATSIRGIDLNQLERDQRAQRRVHARLQSRAPERLPRARRGTGLPALPTPEPEARR